MRKGRFQVGGWSYGKVARVAGGIAVGQLALVYLFGQRAMPSLSVAPPRVEAAWEWLAEQPEFLAGLPDPAVLAEVTDRGFSGALWRRREGQSAAGLDWERGVSRLSAVGAVGPVFAPGGIGESSPGQVAYAAPLAPGQPSPGAFEESGPPPPTSILRLGGELTARRLLFPGEVPAWPHTDVLAPSAVQLLVERDGTVLSAALLPPGSGVEAADREALRWAQQFRFEVVEDGGGGTRGLQWGTVTWVWRTVEPGTLP